MQRLRSQAAAACLRSLRQAFTAIKTAAPCTQPSSVITAGEHYGHSNPRFFSSTNYSAGISDWIPTSIWSRQQKDSSSSAGTLPDEQTTFVAEPPVDDGAATLAQADQVTDLALLAENDALASAAEGAWPNTVFVEKVLVWAHDSLGVPWWEAIAISTVCIRTLAIPLAVMTMKQAHKLSKAKPELTQLQEWMKEQQMLGKFNYAETQKKQNEIMKKHNTSMMAPFIGPAINGIIFLSFYRAIINFADAKVPSMVQGGPWFVLDLASADPTYILPILSSITFLVNAETGAAEGMEGQPEDTKARMKWVMRIVAVVIPIFASNLPAGVFVYWVASNIYSFFFASVLRVASVRSFLGLFPRKTAGSGSANPPAAGSKPLSSWLPGTKAAPPQHIAPLSVKTVSKPKRRKDVPNR